VAFIDLIGSGIIMKVRIESIVIAVGLAVCFFSILYGVMLAFGFSGGVRWVNLNTDLRLVQQISILVLSMLLIERLLRTGYRFFEKCSVDSRDRGSNVLTVTSGLIYMLIATACLTQAFHFIVGRFSFWYVVVSALTLGLAFFSREQRAGLFVRD